MERKSKKIWIIVGLVLCLVAVIGITFAFFSTGGTQDTANTFTSGCLNIELTDASASINLTNTYPISDVEGVNSTSYDFTIRNTCDTATNYSINLESLNEVANSLNADYIKVSLSSDTFDNVISKLSDNTEATPEIDGAYESYTLYTASLGAHETKTYHLKLWIDYDATVEQAANKTYSSKINVIANPETSVVDNLEAKFNLEGTILTSNLTQDVMSASYCITEDNICEPNISVSISDNSYSVGLLSNMPTKQVETALGTLTVNSSDTEMVCTKLNETSKIICSNPNEIDVTPNFSFTSEQADNEADYCSYNSVSVYSVSGKYTKENCQTIYEVSLQSSGISVYYDKSFETVATYAGTGIWDGNSCTYEGNTVIDFNEEAISSKENCGDVYELSDGDVYVSMINKVGSGTWKISEMPGSTGIYETTDNLGTSYYYRGAVKNNYVSFAGYYWRIIRINGDGSIRIIYDGTSAHANGESSTDRQIGISAYNKLANASYYVGYTYTNVQRPSSQNSGIASTIKEVLDSWYTTNIINKGLDSKVASTPGFCNDRNIASGSNWAANGTSFNYVAHERLNTKNMPTLQCSNHIDLYATKVGLITADEVSMAGGTIDGPGNSSYYLRTGQNYWTMSPAYFSAADSNASVFRVNYYGNLSHAFVNSTHGVRPVINLRNDIELTGTGSQDDPFKVVGAE